MFLKVCCFIKILFILQLRLVNDEIRFELTPDQTKNTTHLTTVKYDARDEWHTVSIQLNVTT